MSNEGNIDFFFRDDINGDITSISIGDVWLYFYKETLVGIRDMTSYKIWILRVEEGHADGYSHRHELNQEMVIKAFSEPYPIANNMLMQLEARELTAMGIQLVADSIVLQINRALKI